VFTWLKAHGIDDALTQPYSGHHTRTSLENYEDIDTAPWARPGN
jgi:integrase/recombinase XerD